MSLDVRQQGPPIFAVPRNEHLVALKKLLESGKQAPVTDAPHPLTETAEARGYLDEGHGRGKVALAVELDE